jgi:hypothetical protein
LNYRSFNLELGRIQIELDEIDYFFLKLSKIGFKSEQIRFFFGLDQILPPLIIMCAAADPHSPLHAVMRILVSSFIRVEL